MDEFEEKPFDVMIPHCEACRGFGFVEKKGAGNRSLRGLRRLPCVVCRPILIDLSFIIIDKELKIRGDYKEGHAALFDSIVDEGLLEPLIVAREEAATGEVLYKLVDGFRRYNAIVELQAASFLGPLGSAFNKIPVFVLKSNDKKAIAECMLKHNFL